MILYCINHRITEAGRDLWKSSGPACPKQGQLQQVTQDCIQLGSEHLQRLRLHNFSRQSVLVFNYAQFSPFLI